MHSRIGTLTFVLLLAALAPAVSGAVPAHASDPEPGAERLVSTLAGWLLERSHGGLRNGLRRKVTFVRQDAQAEDGEIAVYAAPQSTAACVSLELLATLRDRRLRGDAAFMDVDEALVREFADAVLEFRAKPDPERPQIYDGAIAGSDDETSSMQYFTTFGNATCGNALLAAYRATGDAAYRAAAVDIAEFLLRMQDPSDHYARFGAHPFVAEDGTPVAAPGGYVDSVSSWGNLVDVISTWNFEAVTFMQAVEGVAPSGDRRYARSAQRARDFLIAGLRGGFDWYTPRFSSPATAKNRIVPYKGDPDYDCRDNRWHRKGSCAYDGEAAVGGTLGTDMIEYGLASLHEHGRVTGNQAAVAEAIRLYRRYADLPGWDSAARSWVPAYWELTSAGLVPTGASLAFDPHLSFGGYFSPAGGPELTRAEARYYDIVGFGILAEIRDAAVPTAFRHGLARLAQVPEAATYAMLDRSLQPLWVHALDTTDMDGDGSTSDRVWKLTRGTLPAASVALGVLRTTALRPAPEPAPAPAAAAPPPAPPPAAPSPQGPPVEPGGSGPTAGSPPAPHPLVLSVPRRQGYRVLARRGVRLRVMADRGERVSLTIRVTGRGSPRRGGTLGRHSVRGSDRARTARVRLNRAGRRTLRRLLRRRRSARVVVEARVDGHVVRRRIGVQR